MEVDEIQQQVSKFQRVCSNGSCSTDNTSNPKKIATSRGNLVLQNHVDDGGVARLYGCPSSRIVRVSRASGGKDRHSKVLTSKGLRDRRVRLSVSTAIQFYDLQDRLGYDQPSKAVEWLLNAASSSIDELPSLDLSFPGVVSDHYLMGSEKKATRNGADLEDRFYLHQNSSSNNNNDNNNVSRAKSPSCSSTSETSKGSGLSLSRSENRTKARERARLSGLKEKDKETDSNQVNRIPENSSFTDLLTGGINTTTTTTADATTVTGRYPIDYFFNRHPQIPQFNILTGDQFSLLQDNFLPTVTTTVGSSSGRELHNFNFLATTLSPNGDSVVAPGGFTRGTLQSNLQSSLLPHHQRFHSSSIDGSTNLPFFIVPNATVDHFTATGGYHLSYGGGGDDGERHSDHHKEKSKN